MGKSKTLADMKIVTCNLLGKQVDILDLMAKQGIFINRTEAIRQAVEMIIESKVNLLLKLRNIPLPERVDIKNGGEWDMRKPETLKRIQELVIRK